MKKGDYYKWKIYPDKVHKAKWVIDYYKSITDENQYDKGHIVLNRLFFVINIAWIIFSFLFFFLGYYA